VKYEIIALLKDTKHLFDITNIMYILTFDFNNACFYNIVVFGGRVQASL